MEVIKQRIMKKLFYLIAALLSSSAGYCQTAQEYFDRGITKYNLENFSGAIVSLKTIFRERPQVCNCLFIQRTIENYIRSERKCMLGF